MEPPAKREGSVEVSQSQHGMLVCPGPQHLCVVLSWGHELEFLTMKEELVRWKTENRSWVCDLTYRWLKFSFWVIWSQIFGIKPMGQWGETKVLWNQMLCPCSGPPGHWCVLGSALWSANPSPPESLVLSSQASSVIHGFVRPLATRTYFLPESWLSSSFCHDQSTEMHLEIRWRDRKRKKKKRKIKMEREENYQGN